MSPERKLLRKILDKTNYINYACNDKIRNEIMEFLFQPEQIEQEQAGYLYKQKDCYGTWGVKFSHSKPQMEWHEIKDIVPVYTHPPKREPLSDEVICEILLKKEWKKGFVEFARAIEREHGIGIKDEYAKELLAQPKPVITQTEAYKKGYLNAVNDLKAKIDNIFARFGVE